MISPMLCNRHKGLPQGPWAYEVKWDGTRALLEVKDGITRIWSRRGDEVSLRFPELTLDSPDCLLDGEIICLTNGLPNFQRLQRRSHVLDPRKARILSEQYPATFVPFDLLELEGQSRIDLPYSERRELLEGLEIDSRHFYVAPYYRDSTALLAIAKEHNLEGIVAKKLDSRYRPGVRSPSWIKHKLRRSDEFVVIGYQYGDGSRTNKIGALLLGHVSKRDGIVPCGKVGTGFTDRELARLQKKLDECAFDAVPGGLLCQPSMVVEVEYQNWSDNGQLRHPSYKGEREDKTLKDLA